MKRTYLFVYADSLGSRDVVKTIIDSIPQIVDWLYDIPNCFYLKSTCSANELVDLVKAKTQVKDPVFFITEITTNRQGYLTKDVWNFLAK